MSLSEHANRIIEKLLYGISIYGVPMAIGVLSLVAIATWKTEYAADGGTHLGFKYFEQESPDMLPVEAAKYFESDRHTVQYVDTHLSESPFWLKFDVPVGPEHAEHQLVELPSRHALEISCWNTTGSLPIGNATRLRTSGSITQAKTGFVITFTEQGQVRPVLCRTKFLGPARIELLRWTESDFMKSVLHHHRNLGLVEGSLIMLAAFVLLAAAINREWTYVLFAAWLVANLRLAALSAGWDTQWLAHDVPQYWLPLLRKLTIASYYILTTTLFIRLFGEDLNRVGHRNVIRLAHWPGLPLLASAIFLPYAFFLPIMWVTVTVGVSALVFLLGRVLYLTRSAVASWYAASLAITLFSGLSEVVAAAFGIRHLIWAPNSITAAASSSLMAALAIAAQMREEREKRLRAEKELRGAYEALPIGLFTIDLAGNFLAFNPAVRLMLGMASDSMSNYRWMDFFASETWARLQQASTHGLDIEVEGTSGSVVAGKTFHVKATISGRRIEGSMQDVTDRARATAQLEYLAEYDPLTNVLNRRGIEKVLVEASRDITPHRSLPIAYIDLDRFKLINDLYGHSTGDDVLREVCARIKTKLGPQHQMGRVGGDEFVVVFPETPLSAAASICRRIVGTIEDEACHIGDKAFQVKGSVGLIEITDATIVRDAVSIADRACREAKRNPASLVVYERDARAFRERADELALIGRFGVSHVPEGLFVDMQPIMSLSAPYDSLDFEVLLRLREPDNSITPAGKVISAAENNGRISLIDRWVLSTTLQWLADNRDRLPKTRFVCINLSGGSLNDEKFIRDAFSMVIEAGSIASMLCFEITESVALHDLGNTNRFIDTVRSHGAKVALDDFGAGYTSFSYLKELAAEAVKIDGAFVRDVNSHPANLAIVEAIAELSHNLGMKTIAEWAEDAETVAVLKEVGVDYVQGYAVARPMSPERLLSADSCGALIENPQVARLMWEGMGRMGVDLQGEIPSGLTLPPLPIRRRH